MCEGNPKKDWLECAELIKTRMNAPVRSIFLYIDFFDMILFYEVLYILGFTN